MKNVAINCALKGGKCVFKVRLFGLLMATLLMTFSDFWVVILTHSIYGVTKMVF